MKKIYKYDVAIVECQLIPMPLGAKILSIALQNGEVKIWAMVNPEEGVLVPRHILLVGTGQRVEDDAQTFLGTVNMGAFVWHFFEC